MVSPLQRQWKLGATMFTLFGVLALVLAAFGLYSTLSYDTARRTHEFGVRAALGARASDLLRLVLVRSVLLAATGAAAGLLAAGALAPRIAALLFQVPARDPLTFLLAAGVLLLAGLLASIPPALRASTVQPGRVLRSD